MDYTEITEWLKNNLNEKRYIHTLGTADCAKELAKQFKLNQDKAYLAGLLHDCAKCFPNEKLLDIIHKHLDVEECEMLNYKTLHAPVSAYIAETEFKITDKEILSAIRWHTLGKLDMTNFEKIVFIADKIEPNTRDEEYSAKIRDLLKCYKETIKSLVKRDLKICLLTIKIYNKLQDLVQN